MAVRMSGRAGALALAAMVLIGAVRTAVGASGTWANPAQPNPNGSLDAGVTFPGTADVRWVDAATATTEFPLQNGDILRVTGSIAGTGLTANTAYWVVNTPSPSNIFQLSATPGGPAIVHNGPVTTPPAGNIYHKWSNAANWDVIPNGVDDIANFVSPAAQTRIVLDQDITLGGIVFNGGGPNDLDIYGGHVSGPRTLTFATSTGMPSITITGTGGTRPLGIPNNNNNGMGINIAGTQGLRLHMTGGNLRINTGVSWNGFTGPLLVAQGNLDPVAGPNTLPAARLILGEDANYARLGLFNGRHQSIGGFDGTTNSFVGNNGVATGNNTILTLGNNNESGEFQGVYGRNDANDATNGLFRSNIGVTKVGNGTQKFSGTSFAAGPTTVNGGAFLMNGTHTATGTTAGNLPVATGTFGLYAVNNGGALGGTGTILPFDDAGATLAMIAVNDGGRIAPGDGVGTLTLDGSATASPLLSFAANAGNGGGSGSFELGPGGASDRIAIVGAQASDVTFFNNVLNFNVLSGATAGDYTLFTADAAGAFTGLTLGGGGTITAGLSIGTGLGAGSSLKVVGNDIVLSAVIGPAENADFDNNMLVNGNDLLIWQRNLGLSGSGTNATGDANGDGNVNANDLAIWKSRFGMTMSTGAAAGVPEPAGLALAGCFAACGLVHLRRRDA
jgi:hypothetical protein